MKTKIRFSDLDYSDIGHALRIAKNNDVVKISGYIGKIRSVRRKAKSGSHLEKLSTLTLKNKYKDEISSLPISSLRAFSWEYRQLFGVPIEIVGSIVKSKTNGNRIKIIRTRSGDHPLRLLQASKIERIAVKKFFKMHFGDSSSVGFSFFDLLKDTILDQMGINRKTISKKISHTVEALIIQAFSGYDDMNKNGRMHIGIIRPPYEIGRPEISIAWLINPIYNEAPHRGIIDFEDLVGSHFGDWDRYTASGTLITNKGLIPNSYKGVFGMEILRKSYNISSLFEIIRPVIDEADCYTAKPEPFYSNIGFIFDLNCDTHKNDSIKNKLKDINNLKFPGEIISRLDFISDFSKDTTYPLRFNKLPWYGMVNSKKINTNNIYKFCKKNNFDLPRFLQLITAHVMEKYTSINADTVIALVDKRYNKLLNENRTNAGIINNPDVFKSGFKNSLYKYIIALTRLQLLNVSNELAVEKAFHLISRKVSLVRKIELTPLQ